jgi:glutathione S-transferase
VAVRFYYGSGSPYAWRVWLALEHEGVSYHRKTLSFEAGDLKTPEYVALNPRRKVPVLVDDDFVLYESAAVVEYIADRWPEGPGFSPSTCVSARSSGACLRGRSLPRKGLRAFRLGRRRGRHGRDTTRTPIWDGFATGDFLPGELSAMDLSVYPFLALFLRIAGRRADFVKPDFVRPSLAAWIDRMQTLPIVPRTRPPHWK